MQSDHAIYGIIGNPVEHSLSPAMHNAAFQALEVEATYEKFPLKKEELEGFFEELKDKASPIFGLNVTVPYKEDVIPYLDNVTPLVERIKAVNTIVINKDRKLIGYNTDAPGFMAHLTELNVETADKRIVILGAGGSARAIIATLCLIPERPESIKVYNRTSSRSEILLDDLAQRIDVSIVEPVMSIDDLNLELADVLINTTSLGLRETDPALIEEDLLHSNLFVYDLIYNPEETLLLRMAKKSGARVANGLGMLYYQGILAFQHWAEREIDQNVKNVMREALEEAIRNS